jgi:hypothetical protein
MELEATHLRDDKYCVRPKGQLGTMGWHPRPWTAVFIRARNPQHAVLKASIYFQR